MSWAGLDGNPAPAALGWRAGKPNATRSDSDHGSKVRGVSHPANRPVVLMAASSSNCGPRGKMAGAGFDSPRPRPRMDALASTVRGLP